MQLWEAVQGVWGAGTHAAVVLYHASAAVSSLLPSRWVTAPGAPQAVAALCHKKQLFRCVVWLNQ